MPPRGSLGGSLATFSGKCNGLARYGRTNPSHNFRILGHHAKTCQEQNAIGRKKSGIARLGQRQGFTALDARRSWRLGIAAEP
jgi:hypothetical protein